MKAGREAIDGFARDVLTLIGRLRPLLDGSPTSWPDGRGTLAAGISRDLATAVEALDAAVEQLYFQADSLESAHAALEIERRAYQELFDGGPDGYIVTDPDGVIIRANARGGEIFRCAVEDLVGERLPDLVLPDDRSSFRTLVRGFHTDDPNVEWIGQAVPAAGPPFPVALTATVVRHADRTPYRVRWSVRDISLRPALD